ncbi:hypothetical protein Pmani_025014 [Petrolisthes manimaculis]|uniref:Uncharacterized protein n=1 Tax=Petrolisthes manimaculis TaxID=1843537 RepID=A0AAE1P841_9EUCA|nr:hypothetical protein Pmani_025014 [Petrolisthes manimaculis]
MGLEDEVRSREWRWNAGGRMREGLGRTRRRDGRKEGEEFWRMRRREGKREEGREGGRKERGVLENEEEGGKREGGRKEGRREEGGVSGEANDHSWGCGNDPF